MARLIYLCIPVAVLLLSGCCGSPATQSASCPYGTYGETCSELCDKLRGTQFDSSDCFTNCTGIVREEGLGDATTCCRQNLRQGCAAKCTALVDRLRQQYGSDVTPEEQSEMLVQCNDECLGGFTSVGVDVDSVCAVIPQQL